MPRCRSISSSSASVAPNTSKTSGSSSSIRLLRSSKRSAEKQASDAEQTIQLDAGYELFAVDSDCSEPERGGGCLKVRTHAESLERLVVPSSRLEAISKTVSFGSVDINSHGVVLGDNPSVSFGPPVTIRWKAFDTQTISLDEYEQHKPESRRKDAMLLPRMVREDWLRNVGFARSEIKETVIAMEKIKQQRCQSSRDGLWKKKIQRAIGLRH